MKVKEERAGEGWGVERSEREIKIERPLLFHGVKGNDIILSRQY